ncbi:MULTISPECIES: nuclease-related domain-containing protein [Nocardioides]|uniref:nuclease-related domain-containing protein n=1 Tax=Nocardioides TaxID=1839 RepID=UPI000A0391A4|nr:MULTISPECIES: nuclease-related domain-containing protein [Nocardioides]
MAGESAREQASRQRAKAARLIESADRWERGANGEVAVASALAELEASGWTVLHDLAWPGRKYANIDHVAIGNGRAFVIDAKNWSGDVATRGGILRQNGRSRAKEVAAVAEAASAVAGLIPESSEAAVRPVLCLVRDDWFAERFGEVLVCSSQNLVAQLRAQPACREPVSAGDLAQLKDALVAHRTVERQVRPRTTSPVRMSRRKSGKKPSAGAMVAAVATIALVLSQPTWFTSAMQRASEEIVALLAPSTAHPIPVEKSPAKTPRPRKQEKVKNGG